MCQPRRSNRPFAASEMGVLRALGIPWEDSAWHIPCPYPDHLDQNPSWRWDGSKGRAYCTCIDRSHSIFDVVMRRESIDFEAAKLRVAEILGRQDLIKVRDGERHQAMDAASLLRPPADQRDENLVRGYLAYRLGVPPDQVPMPSTPVVGWRSLPYYDPPAEGGRSAEAGRALPLRGVRHRCAGRAPPRASDLCRAGGRREGGARVGRTATARSEEVGYPEGRQSAAGCVRALGRPGKRTTPAARRGYRDFGCARVRTSVRDRGRRDRGCGGPVDQRHPGLRSLAGHADGDDRGRPG